MKEGRKLEYLEKTPWLSSAMPWWSGVGEGGRGMWGGGGGERRRSYTQEAHQLAMGLNSFHLSLSKSKNELWHMLYHMKALPPPPRKIALTVPWIIFAVLFPPINTLTAIYIHAL